MSIPSRRAIEERTCSLSSFSPSISLDLRTSSVKVKMISKLLDLAMLWEYLPVQRNPMELVRVKGSTKRQKPIVIITPQQFRRIVEELPEPYSLMVLVCGCLGLRVSECLALKWIDFD
jgi:integrase